MKRIVVAAMMAAFCLAVAAPAHAVRDFSSTALNIIPSGQWGAVPPPKRANDQAKMYDALTPLFDDVTKADLLRNFKSEKLGIKKQGRMRRERVPRKGVRIFRDKFNVPHIYGRTNDDVTWGAGWALAKDRELLLEQARYNARVAVVDAPGLSAIGLVVGLKTFNPSAQTERELAKEVGKLKKYGKPGRQLLHDMAVYVKGVNAYYKSPTEDPQAVDRPRRDRLQRHQEPAVRRGRRRRGGRRADARRAAGLAGRRQGTTRSGTTCASARTRRRRSRSRSASRTDPRARTAAATWCSTTTRSSACPCPGWRPRSRHRAQFRDHASNVLMVAGKRSKSGNPLFVGGPQIGYFYPGLTLEMDLHGPGWNARGATSAPFPGYILIGRREDFVWTLTSAGADIIDMYVETLCEGSDTKYLYRGQCTDMSHFNAGTLDNQTVEFNRTVHGPVVGYATVGGRRVAVSRKRSSYLLDGVDLLLFQKLTRGKVPNARAFLKAAAVSPQTFNTFYADSKQVAQITTGRLPLRPAGVDAGLPTDGQGQHRVARLPEGEGTPAGGS